MALSTIKANPKGNQPIGYTWENREIFTAGRCVIEDIYNSCVPPSIANPAGQLARVDLTYPKDENMIFRGLWFEWSATNADATNAPSFKNVFSTLYSVKIMLNGREVLYLQNPQAIHMQVQHIVRSHGEDYMQKLLECRNQEINALTAGEEMTESATTYFSLPLHWLFPAFEGMPINVSGVDKIGIEVVFAQNYSSLLNGLLITSNTTANAYDSDLTYSNIQVRTNFIKSNDPRVYFLKSPQLMFVQQYEVKSYTVDMSSANTQIQRINITNDFSKRTRAHSLALFAQSSAMVTAYNDSDSGVFYSGATYLGFKILSRGRELLDYSQAKHIQQRRLYEKTFQENRYGKEQPMCVPAASNNLALWNYYVPTIIDFSGLETDPTTAEGIISGIDTRDQDLEVIVYTGTGTVNASTTLYAVLCYNEIVSVDSKSRLVNILR